MIRGCKGEGCVVLCKCDMCKKLLPLHNLHYVDVDHVRVCTRCADIVRSVNQMSLDAINK